MTFPLTEQAQAILSIAQREARQLNHGYVGTEHVLLALLIDRPLALAGLGVSPETVRDEIDKLVTRGPVQVTQAVLPLTPRARRVLGHAETEARTLNQGAVEPDQLLLGLISEPDGVAGMVLRSLGLDLAQVRTERLKVHLEQMRIVERVVRPVRAGIAHKRKMREELLAHLAEIYTEEQARLDDPAAALKAAAKRLGDPAELARELQDAVPASERLAYHVERWLGWRPPESVARMMGRNALVSFVVIAVIIGVPVFGGILYRGWDHSQAVAVRVFAALIVLTPAAQFALGCCYYRMRDSLFGAFGARRSLRNAGLWGLLAGGVVVAAGMGFIAVVEGTSMRLADSVSVTAFAGIATAILCLLLVRVRGPIEIRDTIWACMNVEAAS
jgi:hypothetical protein